MATSRLSFAILAVGALTGCATYQGKELNPATTQTQFESRSLSDPALERFVASHRQTANEDWDLARLTLAAFYFSPELDVARARVAEAEAAIRSAKELPNPSFTFTPGYNQDAVGGVSPWILGYALNLPLELAGKRTHRTAEAQHKAEEARLDLARVAWSTRSAVRRALAAMHAAGATAEIWRHQRPLLAQAAQLVDAQVRAGEVSPLDAAQARVALHRADLAARESDRALATARSRLAESVGVPPGALAQVRLSYRGLAEPAGAVEAADARRWAARNRADLLSALAAYAASQAALQAEVVRHYADLNLGPGYELDQGDGKWSLALGVTLPLFHRNQGPIAQARARRETAAAQFLALQHRVLAEVDRAAADYTAVLGDLDTAKAIRRNLELQARVVAARQAAGESSRLDLTRAQIELAEHSRTELEARLRAEAALGAFEDAVQRPLAWPDSAWRSTPRTVAQ